MKKLFAILAALVLLIVGGVGVASATTYYPVPFDRHYDFTYNNIDYDYIDQINVPDTSCFGQHEDQFRYRPAMQPWVAWTWVISKECTYI